MHQFSERHDAIVIGGGHNGLVAANVLSDAGWDVAVYEASDKPGGAVQTAELTAPGFRNDVCSAFYPLGKASPVLSALELDRFGLRWRHAAEVLANPTVAGKAVVLSRSMEVTCESLERFEPGAGSGWQTLFGQYARFGQELVAALMSPFPPLRAGGRLGVAVGARRFPDFVRFSLLSARRLAEEAGIGEGGALLLAGNALHADLTPEATLSGIFGWLLASLGQDVGFPVPEGGAAGITDALVGRLAAAGVAVATGTPVERIVVESGKATGVQLTDGTRVGADRAVISACDAQITFLRLLRHGDLPASFLSRLGRFERADATFKLDWALSRPIPWSDPSVSGAGTVHIADSVDELTTTTTQLVTGHVPAVPFIVMGQMTTADPSRSPEGTESAWAYTHVPQAVRGDAGGSISGTWDEGEVESFAERMEQRIERLAPGFRSSIVARHAMAPPDLERHNPSLIGGDLSGGTMRIEQQLIFRPTLGNGRPTTPVRGLFLGSSSAHPGGGVHGACGANAARAALTRELWRRAARPRATRWAARRVRPQTAG